jgi:hypothetical protein
MPATLGDTFRVYVKPSLEGELVIRKKTSNQSSGRVKARQDKVHKTKNTENAPAKVAHKQCESDKKTRTVKVYVPGEGYKEKAVCPIKEMKSYLKTAMEKV